MNETSKPVAKSKIQIRIEAARAALDAESKRLSPEDLAEIAEREELAKIEAEKAEAEAVSRALDLDRRLDAAQEKYPGTKVVAVAIKGLTDSFILKTNEKAYKAWDKTLNDAKANAKIDPQEERRKVVIAHIVDWNGQTDLGPTSLVAPQLVIYLGNHQGMVAPLVQAVCEMNGVVKEERKSAG